MTQRVLFNGVVLVKPGGATKVNTDAFNNASLAGVGVVGIVGEADGGEPGVINVFTAAQAMKSYFRSGPLAQASILFGKPGDNRIPAGASQVVAVKANQSLAAEATLEGYGVAQASVTGTVNTPFALVAGSTLPIAVDGAGVGGGAVFSGTRAALTGTAGTFATAAAETMTLKIDDGFTQTITMDSAAATVAAYIILINGQLLGGEADLSGGQIRIRSDRRGSTSKVQILTLSGTLAAKTGLSVATGTGTGAQANLDAITFAEAKAAIETAYAGVTVTGTEGGPITITSDTVGAGSSLQVSTGDVATAFGLPTTLVSGVGAVDVMKLTAREYGLTGNKVSYQVSSSGGGKIIELTLLDGLKQKTETSPVLGAVAKFTIEYTGNGSSATMAISATALTTTISGQSDGSANLNVPFSEYATIQDLINYIDAQPGYDAAAVANTNPFVELTTDLDYSSGTSIMSAASVYSTLTDMITWVNENSALAMAERVANGPSAPVATVKTFLSGGARGISSNTNWQDCFNLLGTVRVNQVVPLASANLTTLGQGSTATITSINAMADAHAAYYSSTAGKSERQAWLSLAGDKTAVKAAAQTLQSSDSCLAGVQKVTILGEDGNVTQYPEWMQALIAAQMRAGAELGEPLTFKFLKISALETHASWNPTLNADEMILAGVMFVEFKDGEGFRWVKGITTYTRTDNDALTEESVVQGWKNVSYELRTYIERLFTGTRASPTNISGIREQADAKLELLKKSGQIVDSILEDGTRLNAYRDLKVYTVRGFADVVALDVTCSPVSGINFTLNTITLVPAQISV